MNPAVVTATVLVVLAVVLLRAPLPGGGSASSHGAAHHRTSRGTARSRRGARASPVARGERQQPVQRRTRLLAGGSLALALALALGGVVGAVVGGLAGSGVGWWLGRQEPPGRVRARERLAADLPHVVDLLAALLRAGQAPGTAAALVAGATDGPAAEVMAGVARRGAAGLDPYAVWRPVAVAPGTELLGAAMLRSLDSGSRVVDVVERVAEELRRDARAAAAAHARTVGVRATAPLAACFLPALVLIGVVPFVASLVGPLLAGF